MAGSFLPTKQAKVENANSLPIDDQMEAWRGTIKCTYIVKMPSTDVCNTLVL